MKIIRSVWVICAVALLLTPQLKAAVTFSLTPSSVSNTYNGYITLLVTGLNSGETVTVQKFLDLNANGVIDGGDLLIQQFTLTDGQAGMVIGSVTNINVPGDTDSTAGEITASLNFANGDFMQNIIGRYLYKLSRTTGPVVTNVFITTNATYAQKISGNVISNGTSATVPNAVVLIFPTPTSGNGPGYPQGGVVANNIGNYSIQLPVGSYLPMVFSSNYVFNYGASPALTLAANQTIATNLTLISSQYTISGSVEDAKTSVGLPGVCIYAVTTNHFKGPISFTFENSSGNFNMSVTSGQWLLGSTYPFLSTHGYVGWYSDPNYYANANTTGINMAYQKATALFYGSVKDDQGNSLAGIKVGASDDNDVYDSDSVTDINGNYVVGVLGFGTNDFWSLNADGNNQPNKYVFSPDNHAPSLNVNSNQAALQNFTAILATNLITGSLKDNNGNPIGGIEIYASSTINGLNYDQESDTDTNGRYSLYVPNGSWDVQVADWGYSDNLPETYRAPADQYPMIENDNVAINFVATRIYTLTNASGTFTYAITNGSIIITEFSDPTAWNNVVVPETIDNLSVTSIGYRAFDAECNSILIPVGVTNIADYAFLDCLGLGSIYFQGPPPAIGIDVFDTSAEVYYLPGFGGWDSTFGGQRTAEWLLPTIATVTLPNCTNGVSYSQQLAGVNGFPPYSWSLLPGNFPSGLSLSTNGLISGMQAINGVFDFAVTMTDALSETVTQALALTVVGPQVTYSTNPTNGPVPLGVQFNSSGVDSGGNPVISWNWNFGDGITTNVQNPTHIYAKVGIFQPSLVATNSLGVTVTGMGPTISVVLPSVQYSASSSSGTVPLNVQFSSPATDSSGNTIIGWTWNFGDGSTVKGENPLHVYTDSGDFQPTLVATNNLGYEVVGSGPAIAGSAIANGSFETPVVGYGVYQDSPSGAGWNFNETYGLAGISGNGSSYTKGNPDAPDGGQVALIAILGSFSQNLTIGTGTYQISFLAAQSAENLGGAAESIDITMDGRAIGVFNPQLTSYVEYLTNPFLVTNGVHSLSFSGTIFGANSTVLIDKVILLEDANIAFTANVTNVVAPAPVRFSAPNVDGDGNAIANWNWSFGDGSMSVSQNPTHVYTNAGVFQVNLTATNSFGFTVIGSGPPINVVLPIPFILSAPQVTVGNANFTFQISGPAGSNYVLQVSTNLVNWTSVSTSSIPVSGTINLTNAISGYNRRFFRAYLK